MVTELDTAYLRARRAFLPLHGVVGVGFGPKLKGDEVVARHAILVFVDRKLPERAIPNGQVIPPMFSGLPTDVRVPMLTPQAESDQEEPSRSKDFCLTDYQWIDWPKIHRRAKGAAQGTGSNEGETP